MTRQRGQLLFLFVTAVAGLFFYVLPAFVDGQLNAVVGSKAEASARALDLRDGALIADLHADTLLWNRNLLRETGRGHVDVPRLIRGNVALQAFTVVTKVPFFQNYERNDDESDVLSLLVLSQRRPRPTWTSLLHRAVDQARRLHVAARSSKRDLTLIQSATDLELYLQRRLVFPSITAGFLGVEGAHALEGKLANVDRLFDVGFRMIGLTHFFDNEVGGSAHGEAKRGLSDFGRRVVERMEAKGMLVDLSHASEALFADVVAVARRPLVVSHTGVRGTCDNGRNLSDEQLRAIARSGGVVGIGYWEAATCGSDVASIARAIRYTVNLIGVEHVALGSDFDGAVTTPIASDGTAVLIEALIDVGMSDSEIHRVLGRNVLDLLAKTLPKL